MPWACLAAELLSDQGQGVPLYGTGPKRAFLTVQLVTGLWAVRRYEDGHLTAEFGPPFASQGEALFAAFEIARAEWALGRDLSP